GEHSADALGSIAVGGRQRIGHILARHEPPDRTPDEPPARHVVAKPPVVGGPQQDPSHRPGLLGPGPHGGGHRDGTTPLAGGPNDASSAISPDGIMVRVTLELAAGDARASIDLEAGGRLASLRLGDAELLLRESRPEFILPSATW